MLSILIVVLPVFALILAGWIARRMSLLGASATSELNRFVVYLALPALLFDIVATSRWSQLWQPAFVMTFGVGAGLIFVATILARLWRRHHLADATVDGLNAAYANTGFVGFPLAVAVLGSAALAPTLIATVLTVCVLFAAALVLLEVGVQTERHPWRMFSKVVASLSRNPLLVSPVLGGLFLACEISIPAPVETFLKLLGGAASPCALVALGLFLAEAHKEDRPASGVVSLLVALKLVAQPAVTWVLATRVFHLSPSLTHAAVLLAALPTGTGPFMIAELYGREVGITSRVILVSTLMSLVTMTLYLAMVR